MKFIVTGGAGFIGSHLTKFLINNGHDVIVIDDLSRGSMNNLHDIKNKIDFRQLDILNYNSIQNVTEKINGKFHQAKIIIWLSKLSLKTTYEKPREGDIKKSQDNTSLAKELIH